MAHLCNNVVQVLGLKEVPGAQVYGAAVDGDAAR
jgi:hypothetical protein